MRTLERRAALAVVLMLFAAAAPASLQQCAGVDDASARLACYDALAGRPAAPVAALPPAAPAPSPQDFGKPARTEEVSSIEARIVGAFRQWQRGTRIELDNGQVWKVTADEQAYYPNVPDNPEVVITRSFFGGYWLELKGVGRRIKVQRIS